MKPRPAFLQAACILSLAVATLLSLGSGGCRRQSQPGREAAGLSETKSAAWNASDWYVEQMPGGRVSFGADTLTIEDKAGCSVWLRRKLKAPLRLSFTARLVSKGGPLDRVSDLNCFWMATDPARPDGSVIVPGKPRSGAFADYDSLRCYYVGMGGNTNTTTRFRRYAGNGERPLLPEHDLKEPAVLLEGNRDYRIEIFCSAEGLSYARDGVVIFKWKDPQPLTEGYFAFRTVWSHLEIRDFRVTDQAPGG
jgi:hypothetical protein